jgi:TRAP-type mannitol/chloroaromatic compound transport system permease small subunit
MTLSASENAGDLYLPTPWTLFFRFFAWSVVATLFAFLFNTYLTFWLDWPGAAAAFGPDASALAWLQVSLYLLGVAAPIAFVSRTKLRSLRQDDATMTAIAAYIVKVAFWTVFLVGIVDAGISFLRVEDFLKPLLGDQLALDLGRNRFRGPYVHAPLIAISVILPAFVRTYGFTWLALLVVVAELTIVISRFIFSYEQAFMSDLVRMWYGALFLFASAYTLIEEGHVRVDVLYSGFTAKTKGLINAIGALVLGLPICWTILLVGLSKPSSIIAGPLLTLEVTQSGFGMYIKYLMAGFLAIYAISMAIQFSGYFLEGVADYRRDPGKRQLETAIQQ